VCERDGEEWGRVTSLQQGSQSQGEEVSIS
jgi:hypothetical protein